VAIDPLPCIGDPAYDAGYWLAPAVQPQLRQETGRVLSRYPALDADRATLWASVVALER
jgi:hypothetical protein